MGRAVALLVLLILIDWVFGNLHPAEFLARRVAPPVRVPSKPPDVYRPNPALKGVTVENPLLKDPHGDINRQMFEAPLVDTSKTLPER